MIELEIYANDATYKIEVTYFYPGNDAVTDRLPEHCTPAEDAEIEFNVISHQIEGEDHILTFEPEEDEEFIELAIQAAMQYKVDQAESEY